MSITFNVENEIGYVELDLEDSKVNLLSAAVLKELDQVLDEVAANTTAKVVIFISKKTDCFIAGADIKEIEKIVEPADGASKAKAGQDIMNKIEDLKVPTIAVIDGVALGGGCELALSCHYRIATFNPKVKIGLPEVNLGFVPGFGGTYRLPRVVGLSESLKLILAGRPIDGSKALKIGLVDQLVTSVGLKENVEQFVAGVISGAIKKKRYALPKKKGMAAFLDNSFIGNWLVFSQSRKSVLSLTKGHYPAPLKAIDVVRETHYTKNRTKALATEAAAFGELAITSISKNLVNVFYISEKYRKLKLEGADDVKPAEVKKAGILGAGVMGGGIAQLLSARGIFSRLKDINHDALASGLKAASKVYMGAVKKRKMKPAEAATAMARITTTLDYSGFKDLDVVIEAVVENMDLKKKVFAELDSICAKKTILATNTSALSVAEMAEAVKDPSRVIGFHFFNPVHRMPLVEIITGPKTSKETTAAALKLVQRLGKTPILVKDAAGFIVNRILLAYISEAGRILEECGQMEAIDEAVVKFGMPMGPFTLSDEVGLDVGIKVMHILEDAFGARFKSVALFDKILEEKLLGRKTGKGFYIHDKKRRANPQALKYFNSSQGPFDKQECVNRLILVMINEAARSLQDGVVDDPAAVDVGMIFGTGFPPFRGGLLKYADDLGIDTVVQKLQEYASKFNKDVYTPCDYLLNLNKTNKKFYS